MRLDVQEHVLWIVIMDVKVHVLADVQDHAIKVAVLNVLEDVHLHVIILVEKHVC